MAKQKILIEAVVHFQKVIEISRPKWSCDSEKVAARKAISQLKNRDFDDWEINEIAETYAPQDSTNGGKYYTQLR